MARLIIPRLIMAMGILASLGGCVERTGQSCSPELGQPMMIFTLFLGKAIPGRDDLTDQEWISFLDTTIIANLPDGYTVFDAKGGWMSPMTQHSVREDTKVVLAGLPEAPESLAAVNRIRTAYQLKFHQQLVGMTIEHGCGSF